MRVCLAYIKPNEWSAHICEKYNLSKKGLFSMGVQSSAFGMDPDSRRNISDLDSSKKCFGW
jgi:hypothetical protein